MFKNTKKIFFVLSLIASASLFATNIDINNSNNTKATTNNQTRTIIDMKGKVVVLPKEVNSVVDLWHANNQVIMMLGAFDKLKGTTNVIHENPWANRIFPTLKNIPVTIGNNNALQTEEVVKIKPDVIITSNENFTKILEPLNFNVVYVNFRNFKDLKTTVLTTGKTLGTKEEKIANEWVKDLDNNIDYIKNKIKNKKSKIKVLDIGGSENLFNVDGGKSIAGEWMRLAGVENVFPTLNNKANVSIEEIIKANPDVIIIGGSDSQKGIDKIKSNPNWKNIKAVKNGKIYKNPFGVFGWDRYSGEEALQILWVAKTMHPEEFKDLDINKKTKEFYKKYYNYDLSDKEAQQILSGEEPK